MTDDQAVRDDRAEQLLAALADHGPGDAREALAIDRLTAEISQRATVFDRQAGPVHVTASAIVVSERGVLLHRHRRLHRWLQPGGHIDGVEPPAEAAQRECAEETGLTGVHPSGGPVLLHVDVHDAALGHVHLDVRYLLAAEPDDPTPPPGESQEVAWFSWEEAQAVADEGLSGALAAARRLLDGGHSVPANQRAEEPDG